MIKKVNEVIEDQTQPSAKPDLFKIIDIGLVIVVIIVVLWVVDKLVGGKLGL